MSTKLDINDCPKVLVVEGYSDLGFLAEALEYVGEKPGKKGGVYIQVLEGRSKLRKKLEGFLTMELLAEKDAIGVVIDADNDADATIQSVAGAIQDATQRSVKHGEWSDDTADEARIGFFVVPDGNQSGEIETLAWSAWANDDRNASARQCIDQFLACMDECGHAAHSPDKGKIGALLAVAHDDDPRLGPAARSRRDLFPFDREEFKPLVDFFRQM